MKNIRYLEWLPLIIVAVGLVAWGVRLESVAGENKEDVKSLTDKSEKWSDERRQNREAQIRYEIRQGQIKDTLVRQQKILEVLEQRTRGLTRQ